MKTSSTKHLVITCYGEYFIIHNNKSHTNYEWNCTKDEALEYLKKYGVPMQAAQPFDNLDPVDRSKFMEIIAEPIIPSEDDRMQLYEFFSMHTEMMFDEFESKGMIEDGNKELMVEAVIDLFIDTINKTEVI